MLFIIFLIVIAVIILITIILSSYASYDTNKNDDYSRKDSSKIKKHYDYNKDRFETPKEDYSHKHISDVQKFDAKGIQGERSVDYYLKHILTDKEYLLTNVLLPLKNGFKTEIDAILISKKGLFCIEIKNWVGKISGDDYSEYWIQEYSDPYIPNRKHRNPVIQNQKHCEILERKLNNEYDVNNAVIFLTIEDRRELYSSSTYDIEEFMTEYKSKQSVLYPEDIEYINDILKKYQATEEELIKHKEQVRAYYKDN